LPVTIRLAVRVDAALLPDIERSAGAVFRSVPDLAWIADDDVMSVEAHERLIKAGTCWIAEDAKPIGFISAELFGADLHIWEISVHADRQGQGIGRRLIEAAVDYARRNGFAAVTLTTFREIAWNEPYYARLGFVTLADDALCPRLRNVFDTEIARGLPGDQRCAMRLCLN
jgi:GNAT superfamily N-acetyltransferase